MSKIQKALLALRNAQGGGADGKGQGLRPLPSKNTANQDVRRRTNSSEIAPKLPPLDISSEPPPKHHIDIDMDRIVDFGMAARDEEADHIAQQFRRIKRPVLQSAFETDLPMGDNSNVIMMASALPGAGKSFCALNLARSIARERDVGAVLIDADVLKPGLSRTLGLEDRIGLIDYLSNPAIEIEDILVSTNLNDIVIIPAGSKHAEATELLASRRMQKLVDELSKRYQSRAVIFDTPPLLITNEAQVLAEKMGQIVIVIEAQVSSQESLLRAINLLDRTKPINAILNKARDASGGGGYGHSNYGYHSYPSEGVSDAVKS